MTVLCSISVETHRPITGCLFVVYYPIHPICRTRQSGRSHDRCLVSVIGEFTELLLSIQYCSKSSFVCPREDNYEAVQPFKNNFIWRWFHIVQELLTSPSAIQSCSIQVKRH